MKTNNFPKYHVGDYVKTHSTSHYGDYAAWIEQYPMFIGNVATGIANAELPPIGELYVVTAAFMSASDNPRIKFDYTYLIAHTSNHKMFLAKESNIYRVSLEEATKISAELPRFNRNLKADIAFMTDRMHPFE